MGSHCCFFAGYKIISVIKILITFVPVVAIATLGCTIGSLALTPRNILDTYFTIIVSPKIGLNVRILLFLTAFIPVLLLPILVLLLSLIVSVLGAIIYPFIETYASAFHGKDVYSTQILKYTVNYVGDVWNMLWVTYPQYLSSKRSPNPDGSVFDIKILHVLIGIILYALALVIDTTFAIVICLIKLIPAIVQSWREVTNMWKSSECFREICCCLYLIIMCCIPIVCSIGVVIGTVYAFVVAINVTFVMFQTDSIPNGFLQIFINIHNIDIATNSYLPESMAESFKDGIFPCFNISLREHIFQLNQPVPVVRRSFRDAPLGMELLNELYPVDAPRTSIVRSVFTPSQMRQETQNIMNERINIGKIWDNFFEMCSYQCTDVVTSGLCTIDDIIGCEPYLFIGLPSLVIFRAIKRSQNMTGIMLSDGIIVTKDNVPTDSFSISVFNEIIKIKNGLKGLNLTDNEYDFIEKWLFTMGNVAKCVEPKGIPPEKMSEIKVIISMIQSIGTNISMIPSCHRRFGDALTRTVSNRTGNASVV